MNTLELAKRILAEIKASVPAEEYSATVEQGLISDLIGLHIDDGTEYNSTEQNERIKAVGFAVELGITGGG